MLEIVLVNRSEREVRRLAARFVRKKTAEERVVGIFRPTTAGARKQEERGLSRTYLQTCLLDDARVISSSGPKVPIGVGMRERREEETGLSLCEY